MTFIEDTLPVVETFRQQGKLIQIDGSKRPKELVEEFMSKLEPQLKI